LFTGLQGGQLTRIDSALVDGRPAEHWRYVPPTDPNILYDKLILTVDKAWCLPLKVDLFGGVPWKTLVLDPASVRQVNGRWTASRATLTDLRQGTTTQIQMSAERTDVEIPVWRFSPDEFYRRK
ncbi:MAG: outer membrane lipoprotein-sorting protein, partial [Stenotrophobium sp.]